MSKNVCSGKNVSTLKVISLTLIPYYLRIAIMASHKNHASAGFWHLTAVVKPFDCSCNKKGSKTNMTKHALEGWMTYARSIQID